MATKKKKRKKPETKYQTVTTREPVTGRTLMMVFGHQDGEPVALVFAASRGKNKNDLDTVSLPRSLLQFALEKGWQSSGVQSTTLAADKVLLAYERIHCVLDRQHGRVTDAQAQVLSDVSRELADAFRLIDGRRVGEALGWNKRGAS